MIKRKYIVAGNYEQYKAYIRKKTDMNTEYIYVDNPNKIRGLSEIDGYYIGTYNDRPDIENIKEIIRITKYTRKVNYPIENEYSVENYFDIGNGRYVEKKDYVVPAEDSVYGNVTGIKIKAEDYWRINSDIEGENRE